MSTHGSAMCCLWLLVIHTQMLYNNIKLSSLSKTWYCLVEKYFVFKVWTGVGILIFSLVIYP